MNESNLTKKGMFMVVDVNVCIKKQLNLDITIKASVDVSNDGFIIWTSSQCHQQLLSFDTISKQNKIQIQGDS